jgi:hypothetical protein
MSNSAISNPQYRLTEESGITRMRFLHRVMRWVDEQEWRGQGSELIDRTYPHRGRRRADR